MPLTLVARCFLHRCHVLDPQGRGFHLSFVPHCVVTHLDWRIRLVDKGSGEVNRVDSSRLSLHTRSRNVDLVWPMGVEFRADGDVGFAFQREEYFLILELWRSCA